MHRFFKANSTPKAFGITSHDFLMGMVFLYIFVFLSLSFCVLLVQFEPGQSVRNAEIGKDMAGALSIINAVFTVLYSLEFILKLLAFGVKV